MLYELEGEGPKTRGERFFVAPNATVIGTVTLGLDVNIWFDAVLRGDRDLIQIGDRSNIQDASILHTDDGFPLTIGTDVTVGHRVTLHGCTVGNNCLIGIGSTILNGAVIGADSIVGAHALVTEGKEFPEGVLILGEPARVARPLRPEEIGALGESARLYVANAERYKKSLRHL